VTPEQASPTPSLTVSTAQADFAQKSATQSAESPRQRSDLAAKVVAGAGTTLLTAVGLAKFSDI
jgi:hypothetical protein